MGLHFIVELSCNAMLNNSDAEKWGEKAKRRRPSGIFTDFSLAKMNVDWAVYDIKTLGVGCSFYLLPCGHLPLLFVNFLQHLFLLQQKRRWKRQEEEAPAAGTFSSLDFSISQQPD